VNDVGSHVMAQPRKMFGVGASQTCILRYTGSLTLESLELRDFQYWGRRMTVRAVQIP
jgi:hypothetical protein